MEVERTVEEIMRCLLSPEERIMKNLEEERLRREGSSLGKLLWVGTRSHKLKIPDDIAYIRRTCDTMTRRDQVAGAVPPLQPHIPVMGSRQSKWFTFLALGYLIECTN
ncbi:hypothetical protein Fmac_006521 [Flemingia macrophylla]|uniref:Uncharacterized protein n=1 Tax=Flemingia macrophylla TaxID=520843 RepID=A0ABD1NAV2_9FABA